MRKAIAIFLLLQIVSNNTFAEEALRLPALFTHFAHHAREHGDTKSFPDFLRDHYSRTADDAATAGAHDEDNDCNLPFRHCNGCCLSIHSPVPGFLPGSVTAAVTFEQGASVLVSCSAQKIESAMLCPVWQPPKRS